MRAHHQTERPPEIDKKPSFGTALTTSGYSQIETEYQLIVIAILKNWR